MGLLNFINDVVTRIDREDRAQKCERAALQHRHDAVELRKKAKEPDQHVTGQQLLDGLRQYALKQFGPMVPTVFEYWGVRRGEDFGEMVFNLIRVGIFGKTDQDTIDDFKGGYTFHQAFVAPYVPETPMHHRRLQADLPAEELS